MPDAELRMPVARNPVQCSVCGCQSPLFAFFVLDKQGNWRCPRCQIGYQQRKQRRTYLNAALTSLILALLATLYFGDPRAGFFMGANVLLYLLLLQAVVPLHELAHAAAAWLMRGVVFAIYLGAGWATRERRIGAVEVAIRVPWLMGFSVAGFPDRRRIAGRTAVYVAAPLAMHALFLLALLPVVEMGRLVSTIAWAEVFLIVNAMVLIENLYPRQFKVGPTQVNTDGMALWLLAEHKTKATDLHMAYFLMAMMYALRAGDYRHAVEITRTGLALYPDQLHLRNGLAAGLIYLRDYGAARPILEDLLAGGEAVSPDIRALAWNNLAYLDVEAGASGPVLEQALAYARQAYQYLPWIPEVRGTLGAALVAQGQAEEGLPHLLAVYPDLATDRARAGNLACQAMARWQQGEVANAHDLLHRARQLDPENVFVQRFQAQIASLAAAG